MSNPIGNKIKTFRLQKNISQEALCGDYLSRVSLSKIENNKMIPSIPQLKYISSKLDVSIAEFFYEESYKDQVKFYIVQQSKLRGLFESKDYYGIVKYYEFELEEFKRSKDNNKNYYLGISFFELEMYGEALKVLKKYTAEYNKFSEEAQKDNVLNFAYALNTLFKIMIKNSNYIKGEHYLVMAKKYLYRYGMDNVMLNFIIHNNLAYTYIQLNKFNKVITLLESFLSFNYKLVATEILANLHISLNIAYYNLGEYEEAIKHIRKGIHLFSYLGFSEYVAGCYVNYANALRYNKEFVNAIETLNRCKKDFSDNVSIINRLMIQEMAVYFNMDNFNKVLELSKSIKLTSLRGNNKSSYLFMVGHVNFLKGNYEGATNYFLKCEKEFIKKNYIKDLSLMYEDLYKMTNDELYMHKLEQFTDNRNRKNIVI